MRIALWIITIMLVVGLLAFAKQQQSKKQHTIVVEPPILVITTDALPGATVGIPYNVTLAASGGTPPYTWTVDPATTLTPGLTLSPDGRLTGTPTQEGTFTFTIVCTDSGKPALTAQIKVGPVTPPTG